MIPAVEAWSLNPWTTREVPYISYSKGKFSDSPKTDWSAPIWFYHVYCTPRSGLLWILLICIPKYIVKSLVTEDSVLNYILIFNMSKTLNLWFVTQMSLEIPYSLMNWWNLVHAVITTNVRVQSPSHNLWVLFTSSSAFSVSSFPWNYALFLFQPMTLTQSFHCFIKKPAFTHIYSYSAFSFFFQF